MLQPIETSTCINHTGVVQASYHLVSIFLNTTHAQNGGDFQVLMDCTNDSNINSTQHLVHQRFLFPLLGGYWILLAGGCETFSTYSELRISNEHKHIHYHICVYIYNIYIYTVYYPILHSYCWVMQICTTNEMF